MKKPIPLVLTLSALCSGGINSLQAATPPADVAAATQQASKTLETNATTWSPEALEDLLAPVALYPDPVLMQLLVAVTNPQEVLDAGNWLIANPDLKGKPQDQAAEKAGFTVSMRALMQFPEVIDKLCLNMPWTEELGQAYVNDQQGVMDSVQRLRVQAQSVGNLKTSPQMKVETKKEAGKPDVIAISPPNAQTMYVPTYDPQAAYAAAAANPPPPGTTITTTTTTTAAGTTSTTSASSAPAATASTASSSSSSSSSTDKGHSTGSMVATGVLAFGAGLLVADIFHDDNWYHSSYYGPMWYRPMPYYPPYPYRPVYGPGFYPGHAYVRPPTYIRGGNTIVINQNNNYYNRYNNSRNVAQTRNSPRSPISAAHPNRPELKQLNARAAQGPVRKAPAASEAWKGKSGYAGNDPAVRKSIDQQAASSKLQQANRPASRGTPRVDGKTVAPKIQGSYAGAKPAADRARTTPPSRPSTGNAFSSHTQSGSSARAASQRGRQSMSSGGAAKARARRR